jgi:hypothetical protein
MCCEVFKVGNYFLGSIYFWLHKIALCMIDYASGEFKSISCWVFVKNWMMKFHQMNAGLVLAQQNCSGCLL